MWSERRAARISDQAAVGLSLPELVGMQPRHLRGERPPGRRGPGGERPGRGRAHSLDFDGSSPYVHGDDARWIDWRATARTGRTQVKRFNAQSHRARMLVADLRRELYFGTGERLMAKTVALVAARLAWESLALHEPVGLVVPGVTALRPRRGRRHVLQLLERLKACYEQPCEAGQAALATGLDEASMLVRRGDELCVISDFAPPWEPLLEASAPLAEVRVLRAFVVDDPIVRAPPPAGRYPSRAPGGGSIAVLDIGARRRAEVPAAAERLDRERRRRFGDGGWQVVDAAALLPHAGFQPP